jgi:hypothetical protein
MANEANSLGEESLGTFWRGSGLKTLLHITNTKPEILPACKIITESGKQLTLTEFLDTLNKLKVK